MEINTSKLQKLLGSDLPTMAENGDLAMPNSWFFHNKKLAKTKLSFGQLMYIAGQIVGSEIRPPKSRTTLWRWKKQFEKLGIIK